MHDEAITLQVTIAAAPVSVAAAVVSSAVVVALASPAAPSVAVAVQTAPQSVAVAVAEAPAGPPGATATPVVLTLAAYLALTAPEQVDPTKWYVIPKAT